MAINYQQLATEINTDPSGLGYATPRNAGDDGTLADMLNLRRASITIQRSTVRPDELVGAIVLAEYIAGSVTAAQRQYVDLLVAAGPYIDARSTNIRTSIAAIFGAGTATRANLLAIIDRQGSRAEQLFGENTGVNAADVARALRG